MLDWVEVGALAGPFHDRDVDSGVFEPALHELRSALRIIVLLELVEQGPVSLPIRQKNKHKKSKSGKNSLILRVLAGNSNSKTSFKNL